MNALDYYREKDEYDVNVIENETSSVDVVVIGSPHGFDVGVVGPDRYERKLSIYEEEVQEFSEVVDSLAEQLEEDDD